MDEASISLINFVFIKDVNNKEEQIGPHINMTMESRCFTSIANGLSDN